MSSEKAKPSFPNSPVLNERYRPVTISDCILKESAKNIFQGMVEEGVIKNVLLSGPSGTGKTTVAKALCAELDIEYIIINASSERGIDVLRTTISSFASTASMNGRRRCVILDESDHLADLTQAAFRHVIEQFSDNCSFIFTCNYPDRIIDALKSRLTLIDFSVSEEEMTEMVVGIVERVQCILNNEGISYNADVVMELVYYLYPDVRRVLNKIDVYSKQRGVIDVGIMEDLQTANINTLINYLAAKDFKSVRGWCANAAKTNTTNIYGDLYRLLFTTLEKDDIPQAILILNDAQRYDHIVQNKELHLVGLCTTLLLECNFIK